MSNRISVFLLQPYPFLHHGKLLLRNAFLVFCIAFFFDYFFEPYNVYRPEHKWPFVTVVLVHALNGASQFLILGFLLGKVVSRDDWKLYKEYLFFALLLLGIGTGSFLARDLIYNNPDNWSLRYLIEEIRNTYLSGSLILFLMTYINFRVLKAAHHAGASHLNTLDGKEDLAIIVLNTPLHSEKISFQINDLILAKAEGNYVRFYLQEQGQVTEKMIRISLTSVAEQMESFTQIIRTHRAFIFNLYHLDTVEGNAQGYFLSSQALAFQVPVSRSQLPVFNERLSIRE